jgi:hypothetical protein
MRREFSAFSYLAFLESSRQASALRIKTFDHEVNNERTLVSQDENARGKIPRIGSE